MGSYYLDFLIADKIVLEIKKSERFSRNNIEQLYAYLRNTGHKLGILAHFGKAGLKFKRILNVQWFFYMCTIRIFVTIRKFVDNDNYEV